MWDYARGMTKRVAKQLIRHGTTAIAAYATVHHESAIAAIDELRSDWDARRVVGQVLMDRGAPDAIIRPARQMIDEAAAMQDRFPARFRSDFGSRDTAVLLFRAAKNY